MTIDDWNGIIEIIKSADKNCQQLMNVLNPQSQQIYAHRLEKTLEQQDEKVKKLLSEAALSKEEMALQSEIEEMFKCHQIFRTSNYEGYKGEIRIECQEAANCF